MTDSPLHFVHISDTHISPDPNSDDRYAEYNALIGARALVEQINALPFTPDFVLHTGDVIYDPIPEAYETAKAVLGQIKVPVYYLPGNHDHSEGLQRTMMGWTNIITPLHYEFEVKGVQIVCLDSNGPAEPPRGYVSEDQLTWLESICKADDDRPLVIAVHHNVLFTGIPWYDDYMRIQNGEDFHRTILPAQKRIRGVFGGHIHQNFEVYRDGILYSSVLSSWFNLHLWPGQTDTIVDRGSEPGFNVVTITHNQTHIRRHRFSVK